MWNTITECWR